jgi:hypothetical protein
LQRRACFASEVQFQFQIRVNWGEPNMHSQGFRVKVIALTFIAIAFPFVANEWFGAPFHKSNFLLLRILNPEHWYRAYTPGEPSQQQVDNIRIVAIARGGAPGSALGENRCTHRIFMSKLLNKLATIRPSVNLVVIDKWYNTIPAGTCGKGPDGTDINPTPTLQQAVLDLAANTNIVIAVASYNHDEQDQFCADRVPPLKPEEVVLADYEHFFPFGPLDEKNTDAAQHVRWGLARINSDLRKIPLGWMAYENCKQIPTGQATMMLTLPTAAAMLVNNTIMQSHNLAKLEAAVDHPYTKLIPQSEDKGFKVVPAIQLVCKNGNDKTDWNHCQSVQEDDEILKSLQGKKIIIGETTREDSFTTEEGHISGPALQASYLASLLSDNSILNPIPVWINRTISGAWLILVFLILWLPKVPERAALLSAFATFAFGWFFNAVISRYFSIFTDLIPPTILEIIGLYLARRIEMLLEQHKESKRAVKKVSL